MGFLDKVKEKAQAGLEKGQDVAKAQQLKHELKKLEGEVEAAYAAFGRAAHDLHAGRLARDRRPQRRGAAVYDAVAARDAKQAEIEALGEDDDEAAVDERIARGLSLPGPAVAYGRSNSASRVPIAADSSERTGTSRSSSLTS